MLTQRVLVFSIGTNKLILIFFNVFMYLCLRERERESRERAEREGDRIPSRLHTVSREPDVGLEPTKRVRS